MKRRIYASSLLLILSACKPKPEAPKVEGAYVLAEVDGQPILSNDFERQLQRIQKKTTQIPSTHLQKKEILEQWINIELLYQEALRQGFDKTFEFKTKLAETYIEDLASKGRDLIAEDKIRSHYEKNRRRYDQIAVRHILLKVEPGASEKEKVQIFHQLEKMREELLKKPDLFDDYARRYSQDSSSRQGGDLGYFTYDMMVKEFSKAAFQLKEINSISPIVSTQFGYHLIQLRADRRGFEHHIDQIQHHLLQKTQKEIFEKEIERLRSKVNIQIYEDELLKMSPLPDIINQDPDEILPENIRSDQNPFEEKSQ